MRTPVPGVPDALFKAFRAIFPPALTFCLTAAAFAASAPVGEKGKSGPVLRMDDRGGAFYAYRLKAYCGNLERQIERAVGEENRGATVRVKFLMAKEDASGFSILRLPNGDTVFTAPRELADWANDRAKVYRLTRALLLTRLGLKPARKPNAHCEWLIDAIYRKAQRGGKVPLLPMAASFPGVHALTIAGDRLTIDPIVRRDSARDWPEIAALRSETREILLETIISMPGGQRALRGYVEALYSGKSRKEALRLLAAALFSPPKSAPVLAAATDTAMATDTLQTPDTVRSETKLPPSPPRTPSDDLKDFENRLNEFAEALSINPYLPADVAWTEQRKNRALTLSDARGDFPVEKLAERVKKSEARARSLRETKQKLTRLFYQAPYFLKPAIDAYRAAMDRGVEDIAALPDALHNADRAFAEGMAKTKNVDALLEKWESRDRSPGTLAAPYLNVLDDGSPVWPELEAFLDSAFKD